MASAPNGQAPSISSPVLAVLGGVVGSAAWASLVGGVVLATRYSGIGIPPGPTVALVPTELQWQVGARFIVLPLALALVALLLLLYLRLPDDNRRRRNLPGSKPRGLRVILFVGAMGGAGAGVLSNVDSGLPCAIVVAAPLAAAIAAYSAIQRASGFTQAGLILFTAVGICAGVVATAYEIGRPARLDLAVVLRSDGSAIGGFYVAKTDNAVYMVTPTIIGASTTAKTAQQQPLPDGATRCPAGSVAKRLTGAAPRCYVNELVAIPADQVGKVLVGPRSVRVGVEGFNAARRLADVASARADEHRPRRRR